MVQLHTTLSADTLALNELVDLAVEVRAAGRSLAELASGTLEDRPDFLLKFVGFGQVGPAAVPAGNLRVSLELTDDGRLLVAALRALRGHFRAIESLLVEHETSPADASGAAATAGEGGSPLSGSRAGETKSLASPNPAGDAGDEVRS